MQHTLEQVLRIGSIALQMTSPSIQASCRLQKFANEHNSKSSLCFGILVQLSFQQKKNEAHWIRFEKVVGFFVRAPPGTVCSYLLHNDSGFEGFQLIASPHPMHQCHISVNVYEQGSDMYHFQASQLTLGYAAATFHWSGHFATGCPHWGSH